MKKEHLRLLPAVSLLFQHSEKKSCHQLCEALESSHKLHQNEDEVHARNPVVIAHNRASIDRTGNLIMPWTKMLLII